MIDEIEREGIDIIPPDELGAFDVAGGPDVWMKNSLNTGTSTRR